nr:phospholipase-like protein [Tanacetum cinerariifolium]
MWLVDDFNAWNLYPWGEYMWEKFYNRIVNVVVIHNAHHLAEKKKSLNFNATYNLYEFAWAFKIWILESYPNSKIWWSEKANVIPREFDALKSQLSLIENHKTNEIDELTERISKFESSQTFVMFKRLLKSGVCTEKKATEEIPNICSDHNDTSNHTACMSTKAMPSSSCSHLVNEDIASYFNDRMENNAENDAENLKDDYTHYHHHLDLLIKACAFKIEIPTIDALVPPNGDDHLLHTMKPNDACDQVDVDHFEDNYMFMLNDEEQPVKTSLDDMDLKQPDNLFEKQGI